MAAPSCCRQSGADRPQLSSVGGRYRRLRAIADSPCGHAPAIIWQLAVLPSQTMSRAQRLLDLIQILRRHRRPVSGAVLAEELGVSLRTLYRDIDTLKAEGAHIDGEAGVGYVLRPGFMLPPLMFSEEEIEALVLGSRWVHQRADRELANAAANVLAKIGAVLPKDLREALDDSGMLIAPGEPIAAGDAQLPKIRQAIRTERKIGISYRDKDGVPSKRTIWPFAVGFFEKV